MGLGKLLRSALQVTGLDWRLGYSQLTALDALRRISDRGLPVKTVIDVGASNGSWSKVAMTILSDSRYFLIEAHEAHQVALQKFCTGQPNAEFVLAAAAAKPGYAYFDDSTLMGGSASMTQSNAHMKRVPATTIDSEVIKRSLEPPFLLKLDTHGFELPILDGAEATLQSASLVVIESYNFTLTKQSLHFYELCQVMATRGFSVIDISDPLWRVKDNSFWQMDLYFIPSDRPEFDANTFR